MEKGWPRSGGEPRAQTEVQGYKQEADLMGLSLRKWGDSLECVPG